MIFEEKVIKIMKDSCSDCCSYSRNFKYLALDLITAQYNSQLLASRAKEEGIAQRLGYLCDVTARAAKMKAMPALNAAQLAQELLNEAPTNWQYLDPALPDYAKRILAHTSSQTELNKKWQVRSALKPAEIADWIDLHITEEYVTAPKRKRA